jgi:hypothetical protein
MSVLIDRMVTAIKRRGTDVEALLVCNFFGIYQPRGVTGSRGGDS